MQVGDRDPAVRKAERAFVLEAHSLGSLNMISPDDSEFFDIYLCDRQGDGERTLVYCVTSLQPARTRCGPG